MADRPLRSVDALILCVFHVPGSISEPDFSGVLIDKYYKDDRFLGIDLAVPDEFVSDDNVFNRNPEFLVQAKVFIIASLREAVRLAAEYFAKEDMPFDEKAANDCVDLMDREMSMDRMKEAVAPPRVAPPSPDLLRRVKKATRKKKPK